MSERSDEEGSDGSDGQPLPNDLKYSSAESAAKDKLYEPKKKRKIIRVLTVMAYVFSVSLAAIMLSLYYVFLWDPKIPNAGREPMALRDPEPHDVRNISCFHHAAKDDTIALPQIQEPESTAPMNEDQLRRSTPLPLLLQSRLSQLQSRTEMPATSNHQSNTNYTLNQLHNT